MLDREKIVKLLHEHYPHLAAEYGVARIGLFGSYVNGQPSEISDIDLIVEFERPIGFRFVELAEYLEQILGRKVDILTPTGVRGIRLPQVAKNIAESIIYV
jgi:hypothetical protein